jgi:hypothetical protein
MFAPLALIFALLRNVAATPQEAAVHVFFRPQNPRLTIARINVVGKYATVLIRGGSLEGSPVNSAILVQRFSFGWQALDLINFRCRLEAHAISTHDTEMLMRGMPEPQDDRPCAGVGGDAGTQAQVEAVRMQTRGPLVPSVVVSGSYALGEWYGAGGGESVYRRHGKTWRLIAGGGGAMGISEMREYGVPQAAWCAFGIYDANCSAKH